MPNVADELAELRKKGAANKHRTSLETKSSGAALSTPEAEEAAIKAKNERERVGNYSKDAEANLKAGVKDVGLENDFKLKIGDKKKEERSKKVEAAQNLHGFKEGKAAVAAAPAAAAPAPDLSDDDDDDDDVPELEEAVPDLAAGGDAQEGADDAAAAGEATKVVQNRAEKKSRKMMTRLGMRPVPGIARVTLKTAGGRGGYFAIDRPDVFVSSGGGKNATYVIFGEARQGGGMPQQQAQEQQMRQAQAMAAAQQAMAAPQAQAETPKIEEVSGNGDEDELDETGVEGKDIELVMSQASCSRGKAVAALKQNDGDLVNAIMSLTT